MQTEIRTLDLDHASARGFLLTMSGLRMMRQTLHDLGYTDRAKCVRASVVSPFLEGPLSKMWPHHTANLILTFYAHHPKRGAAYVTVALPFASGWTHGLKH